MAAAGRRVAAFIHVEVGLPLVGAVIGGVAWLIH